MSLNNYEWSLSLVNMRTSFKNEFGALGLSIPSTQPRHQGCERKVALVGHFIASDDNTDSISLRCVQPFSKLNIGEYSNTSTTNFDGSGERKGKGITLGELH